MTAVEKVCKKCNRMLSLQDFYQHPAMTSGYLNFCKGCVKHRVKIYRNNNINHIREYDRKRGKLSHRIVLTTKATKEFRIKHPEKYKAHTIVGNAIRDKRLNKPNHCENCGTKTKLRGHHEDYSKPLIVIWLCQICHSERHKEIIIC